MSALVTSLQAGTPPYQTACAGITGFVSAIEGESIPDIGNGGGGYAGFNNAQNVFTKVRTDAMQWINVLFPEAASLPQTFINEDTTVQGQLTALISSCSALSQPGADQQALQNAITADLAGLIPTVQSLQTQSAGLATSLAGSQQAMTADQAACQQEVYSIQNDLAGLQQQYANLRGQLDQAEHATCPSSSTISSLESGINSVERQMQEAQELYDFFGALVPQLGNMVNSLHYLNGFWSAVAANGTAVVSLLQKAAADPVSLLQVDLQTSLQQWQGLIGYMKAAV